MTLPRFSPMLAMTGEADAAPREWVEIKWDGYRCLAYIRSGATELLSRRDRRLLPRFAELADLHRRVRAVDVVMDGEIVAFDQGVPSFHTLHFREGPATYIAFDLLAEEGTPVIDMALRDRRRRLEAIVAADERLQLSPVFQGSAAELRRRTAAMGLEGIVVKDPDSPYVPGRRTPYWRKVKNRLRLRARLIGMTSDAGRIRALLLGIEGSRLPRSRHRKESRDGSRLDGFLERHGSFEREGSLHYIGRVGSGIKEDERRAWYRELQPLEVDTSPLTSPPPAPIPDGVTWLKPVLSVSVEYAEWTPDGLLRQPSLVDVEWERR